jgi:hypothetical protein
LQTKKFSGKKEKEKKLSIKAPFFTRRITQPLAPSEERTHPN